MILVSIIICVYNKSKYLEKCLDSVLNQTHKNLEIIIIEDGSNDNSLQIISSFAKIDSRIKIFPQENKGIGFSRMKGIKLSKGKYLIHIDPDDYVELDYIESLVKCAELNNSLITICDFDVRNDSHILLNQSKQQPTSLKSEIIMMDIVSGKLHGSLCNKLIKKELYKNENLRWPINLSFCEDQIIILQLLKNNIQISYLNKSLYHYIKYDESLTNQNTKILFNNFLKYLDFLKLICGKEYKYIYHTSALYSKYYLINTGYINKYRLYIFKYSSLFYMKKSGLNNYQKKVIYSYLYLLDRLFFKILSRIL